MAFIEIKNLDKTFFPGTNREQYALKNVSLDIKDGDFITILGGNGAGKSTFLNALAGSFSLDNGEILIEGRDISNIVEHKRAEFISRVFQNPLDGTAPRMTVAQNMSLALRRGKNRGFKLGTTKEDRKLFKELLATLDLGLEDRLDSEMGLLSGGQRQAIALLMATITTPKLLLLDEHTAALDPKTQKKIMELTREKIEEKNLTALMITHNIQDAVKYGNRIIILHRGQLVRDINREEKEKLKKKRISEYNRIFKELSQEKKKLIKKSIEQAVHMEMQLDDLQIELEKVGFVEEYCNGNNQFGKKESTESKAYNTLMKNYISIIKVLLGELPQSKNEDDDEEFKKFLMDRVKR